MIEMRWIIAPSNRRELEYRYVVESHPEMTVWSPWYAVPLVAAPTDAVARAPDRGHLIGELAEVLKSLDTKPCICTDHKLGKYYSLSYDNDWKRLREILGEFGLL